MTPRGDYSSRHGNYSSGRRKTLRDVKYSESTRAQLVAHRRLLNSLDETASGEELIGPSISHYRKPARKK